MERAEDPHRSRVAPAHAVLGVELEHARPRVARRRRGDAGVQHARDDGHEGGRGGEVGGGERQVAEEAHRTPPLLAVHEGEPELLTQARRRVLVAVARAVRRRAVHLGDEARHRRPAVGAAVTPRALRADELVVERGQHVG